jgi:hypothetical protein
MSATKTQKTKKNPTDDLREEMAREATDLAEWPRHRAVDAGLAPAAT